MSKKLGFTGTRSGMTDEQESAFERILNHHRPSEAHHGDCVGADHDFYLLLLALRTEGDSEVMSWSRNCKLVLHPPDKKYNRAFCGWDECRPPAPYLVRDHEMVDEIDVLLACPKNDQEQLRSGTWATVRYARQQRKHIIIVWPDGTVQEEHP
jgi:hypothetical protein